MTGQHDMSRTVQVTPEGARYAPAGAAVVETDTVFGEGETMMTS
jgi:hypothetical protein